LWRERNWWARLGGTGRGTKAKQITGQKKLIERKKGAFMNTREKEIDRMKEEL